MDDQDLFSVFQGTTSSSSSEPKKSIDALAAEAREAEIARMQEKQDNSSSSGSSGGVGNANDGADSVEMDGGTKKRKLIDLNDAGDEDEEYSDKQRDDEMQQDGTANDEKRSSSSDGDDDNNDNSKEADGSAEAAQQEAAEPENLLMGRDKCLHEVALPPDYDGEDPLAIINQPIDRPAAKQYPFVLDAFQSESVKCLEKGHSVLVSAHTSAGKTAIAEYAIAMSLRDGSRVVYTSPIKALSNQKYRELTEEFKDVGLMTGDVTINPNASCLVMTTEILRSMLYRGSEVLNEVAWVIFDEVHYMRDKDRGVVWEETMILLPNSVRYVFLSATIPNALEFAEWIAKLKGQPVHVVYTDYRPTPLQHYVYPCGGDGIYLTVDEKSRFREDNYQKVIDTLTELKNEKENSKSKRMGAPQRKKAKQGQGNTGTDIYKLVKMIMERNFEPVIIFSFSRRDCETYAMQMAKLDLNPGEEEKELVTEVFNNAIDSLGEDDRKLPQVEHMLPLLKKGIGIHHSGLLPIIKEVIEILFQEGLVKALFSTETFSMGLNMPARCVVFTQLKKFDGEGMRLVSSGEYIQMSGRAGRRGIDDRGIVILMMGNEKDRTSNEEWLDIPTAKQMMSGKADPLNSSFHLSYYMILNLLRVEEITPEYIMERSFLQYQSEKKRPQLEKRLEKLQSEFDALPPLGGKSPQEELQLTNYFQIREQIRMLQSEVRAEITKPIYALNFLQPGRLVRVQDGENDWGWGAIINFQKSHRATETNIKLLKASDYIVDVMVKCDSASTTSDGKFKKGKPQPAQEGRPYDMVILPVQMDTIDQFSSIRIYLNPNLHQQSAKDAMKMRINETMKRFPDGLPLLDPIADMKIKSKALKEAIKKIESLEQRLFANPMHNSPEIPELYKEYVRRRDMEEDISQLKREVRQAGQIVFKDDLKKMMRVLRRLGCTDQDNVIQAKGRVACEISTSNELVLTEMMFNGDFNDLEPAQVVALLCCACYEDRQYVKEKDKFRLPNELAPAFKRLQEAAKRVAQVTQESKIDIDVEEFVDSFAPTLMEVTYAWCKGAKFIEICKMTNEFEGSIVRTMRRLEELLRQMCVASKSVGDSVLEEKFLKGIELLKRDIVFSSSLYIA